MEVLQAPLDRSSLSDHWPFGLKEDVSSISVFREQLTCCMHIALGNEPWYIRLIV